MFLFYDTVFFSLSCPCLIFSREKGTATITGQKNYGLKSANPSCRSLIILRFCKASYTASQNDNLSRTCITRASTSQITPTPILTSRRSEGWKIPKYFWRDTFWLSVVSFKAGLIKTEIPFVRIKLFMVSSPFRKITPGESE